MKFSECIPYLLQGKRFKKENWKHDYIVMDCGVLKLHHGHTLQHLVLNDNDLSSDDWVERQNPISLKTALEIINLHSSELISFQLNNHELVLKMEQSYPFELRYSSDYVERVTSYSDTGRIITTYVFLVEVNCDG